VKAPYIQPEMPCTWRVRSVSSACGTKDSVVSVAAM
jgi:hypothetical protein